MQVSKKGQQQSFAEYVKQITSQSVSRLQQTSTKQFRSTNLPQLLSDMDRQPYMMSTLDQAKFPKVVKMGKTSYLNYSSSEQKNFEEMASKFVRQLEQDTIRIDKETPRINLMRFQFNIQKSRRHLQRRSPMPC
ncbi:unnamed protein product (macronuclear) [Paramecium tetraurelia]|uniref:Uncharacterized protein n=1 Tax=Paramecium tetraurelia TaxID=5888 RepID=A0CES9_PARTE|nr:uncharacterized protein GSPATT00037735001 [Paramecium tetraurelia]CAK69296.1 unnamed protein product [Paramecium tetraurelia]|eukprot:XP_001436693.1 hypothetical protein (macronuclear) [Paramecium tetraurelia strain d4-2]